jgi:DNA (cytosine-5)-methyltransferase 1
VRYLSVCSGIEAASVAWHPLGWEPAAFCEIEPFPSAVLAHRFPGVPNYGDFTRLTDAAHPIHDAGVDILVGGTPCQAFSVAGLRRGLADPRGGLTLEFVRLAQALRPKWIVWENVPGVLSQDGGRAFGAFLGALGELGYGWAYRVLDAQYVRVDGYPHAVPQRRRRLFVVGCAGGDFARAAAVLLEPESVRGDPPTRRATREGAASDAAGCAAPCFWNGQPVAESLTCMSDDQRMPDKGRMQMVVQPIAFSSKDYGADASNVSPTLRAGSHRLRRSTG